MQTISRADIPADFSYYRTGSKVFYEYLSQFRSYLIREVNKRWDFFSAVQIFPWFWSITAEKIDTEITKEMLNEYGIKHGIIWWTPLRKILKPKGWLRLPTYFMKWNIHSSRSAFSVLDTSDYWEKWSSKARAHRRKTIENREKWIIQIRTDMSLSDFLDLYRDIPTRDGEKWFRLRLTKKLFEKTKTDYRIYTIYVDGKPLAWALFIDMSTTSEYFASFYHRDGYPYHLGIAMMDTWFLDSYAKWIKYCDLDHMRDSWQSPWYAGYTKFKESIADYDVYFHDMWLKVF